MTIEIDQFHSCNHPLEWKGCYDKDSQYTKYVTPDSYSHPAKMAFGLLERIFKHLQEMRLVEDNTTIVDFMAGTFRTGVMAELFGYRSIGIELEPHFIKMIEGNRAQIEKLTGRRARMGFMQGDARQLSAMLKEKGCVDVVSPPYADAVSENHGGKDPHPEMAGGSAKISNGYSAAAGNIGNLRDAPLVGITSPPYANRLDKGNEEQRLKEGTLQNQMNFGGYTTNEDNIANLPDRQLVGITSPPFESSTQTQDIEFINKIVRRRNGSRFQGGNKDGYGENPDNLGNQNGSTYLEAMLQVCSEACRSGISPLVLVTKNPTRNGKLRRLDLDTVRILQLSGYEIFDYHRAILFEEVTQATLGGEVFTKPKGRLSFFKRLSYEKGNVVARWEDIIFARIPNGHGELTGITSPPYQNISVAKNNHSIDKRKQWETYREQGGGSSYKDFCNQQEKHSVEYSQNPANIGNLPDKEVQP